MSPTDPTLDEDLSAWMDGELPPGRHPASDYREVVAFLLVAP